MATALLQLKVDPRQIQALEKIFADAPKKINKVLYRALNRVARTIKSRMTKAAAKSLGIKQKLIRKRIFVDRANRKRLRARVKVGAAGFPFFLFNPKKTRKGLRVRVRARRILPHAFIARMPTGHEGVFMRGRSGSLAMRGLPPEPPRLPIREQFTTSPTRAVEEAGATPEILREAADVLQKRIVAEVGLIITGKRR